VAQVLSFQEQTVKAYGQVDVSVAAVDLAKRYRVAFVVKNLFNDHYSSAITSGGPFGSYLYQIPRDSSRYWGVTLHTTF
jgi:iron complex outermembrane receptor protein